ncbi:hypothetical protein M514_20362 [Trichuris suis]|uniref:Uncharacterized protein n=1 Tax=Trichuris suis TaxID=68888 RepID=A0A085LPZ2_9BILA|nr:hypothetical protein M513_12078 [Trichuris suis]KFD47038.1 hypothetical protein M513_12081 [Trichuris suis]KFD67521.1 hypothetical protein M514_20362 [Trichuris suis]
MTAGASFAEVLNKVSSGSFPSRIAYRCLLLANTTDLPHTAAEMKYDGLLHKERLANCICETALSFMLRFRPLRQQNSSDDVIRDSILEQLERQPFPVRINLLCEFALCRKLAFVKLGSKISVFRFL